MPNLNSQSRAKHTAALGELAPLAKEINAHLKTAGEFDGKADDRRLTAAIALEKASALCREAKMSFKSWVAGNIEQSYDECRKLAVIGASPDPAKALADMRSGAAVRSRALRKRQAAVLRDTAAEASVGNKPLSHYEGAEQGLALLSHKDALTLIDGKLRGLGMRVVSEADAKRVEQAKKDSAAGKFATIAEVKTRFLTLKASDKLEFVRWAADNISVGVTGDFQDDSHLTDIPASMRRTAGNGPRRTA